MDTAIEVSSLVFEYPGKRALRGVSFTIERGTVTALVGPNGAGKTTLLRCLSALETPYSGLVHILGRDTAEDPRACHRHLGYLADFYGLYSALNAGQCLRYMAMIREVPAQQLASRVAEVAADMEIDTLLDMRPTQMSRGQRQRLAVAQAMVHRPEILLLDEPAAGLDPEARYSLSKLLRRLQGQGVTIVVSSHILNELEDYSTHMLTIKEGNILGHEKLGHSEFGTHIRLKAHGAADQILDQVRQMSGVSDALVDRGDVLFRFASDPQAQSDLLGALRASGVQVYYFAAESPGMASRYLEQLAR